jgi:hypothetical protein
MMATKTRKLKVKSVAVLATILIAAAAGLYLFVSSLETKNYYDFAKCLYESKATEYGTEKCLFCQKQKRVIGLDAFNTYMKDTGFYVQCDVNEPIGNLANQISRDRDIDINEGTVLIDICQQMAIDKTPTWVINGERYVGLMEIPALAEASGCPIPADYTGPIEVGSEGKFTG